MCGRGRDGTAVRQNILHKKNTPPHPCMYVCQPFFFPGIITRRDSHGVGRNFLVLEQNVSNHVIITRRDSSLCYRLFKRAQQSHRSTSNPTTTIRSFVPEIRITIKSVLCLNCRFSIHHPLSANSAEFLRIEESAPIRQNMCKVKCFLTKWSNIPERCGFTFHFYLLFKRSGSFHPKIPPYSAVPAEIATSNQTPCLGSQ